MGAGRAGARIIIVMSGGCCGKKRARDWTPAPEAEVRLADAAPGAATPLGALERLGRDGRSCIIAALPPLERGFLAICSHACAAEVRAYERNRDAADASAGLWRLKPARGAPYPAMRWLADQPEPIMRWAADAGSGPAQERYLMAAVRERDAQRLRALIGRGYSVAQRVVCAAAAAGSPDCLLAAHDACGAVMYYGLMEHACESNDVATIRTVCRRVPHNGLRESTVEPTLHKLSTECIKALYPTLSRWGLGRLCVFALLRERFDLAEWAWTSKNMLDTARRTVAAQIARCGSVAAMQWLFSMGAAPNPSIIRDLASGRPDMLACINKRCQ